LLAVVAASPGTISVEGTYTMLKGAKRAIRRYRIPATLAVLFSDAAAMWFVIFIPPD
jgi:hypothetical protein